MMKNLKLLILFFILLFIQGCSRMPTPDFQHLVLPKTPNYCLACPEKFCNVQPTLYSPVYKISADNLFNEFNHIISQEPRIHFVYSMPEDGQFGLVARSQVFQFPDDIAVQFIALSDHTSTIAIYSKARYGYYDFGVNKKRVAAWLNQLTTRVNKLNPQK